MLLTTSALVLLAVLAWVVWSLFTPGRQVQIACLAIGDYNVLDAQAMPFVRQDLDRWRKLEACPRTSVTIWDNLTEATKLRSSLGQQLKAASQRQDVLVLFLSAQGVSVTGEDGQPSAWLLASDYDSVGGSGRYRLDDLLARVAECPAPTRLLVLDAGAMEADVGTGMLVNEFPLLLEEAVRAAGDTGLWVLASHDLLEQSHVSYKDRASVFAKAVADGLSGAADSSDDDDSDVDLTELFNYTRAQVGAWVWHASDQTQTQTPLLLQGGSGRRENVEPVLLTKSAPRPQTRQARRTSGGLGKSLGFSGGALALGQTQAGRQPASDKAEEVNTAQAGQSEKGRAEADRSPSGSASAEGETKPDSAEASDKTRTEKPPKGTQSPSRRSGDPAVGRQRTGSTRPEQRSRSGDQPNQQLLRQVESQWKLLDRMGDRARDAGWTPADYAPHLWRQCFELLLGYERQARGGAVLADRAAAELLATRLEMNSILAHIEGRRRDFELGRAKTGFEQHPVVVEAVRQRNDALVRARSYVRWCGEAGISSQSDLGRQVSEYLAGASELVSLLAEEPGAAGGSAANWLDRLGQITGNHREIQERIDQQVRLEVGLGSASGVPRGRKAAAPLGRYSARSRQIEILLSTALPSASERQVLWSMLEASQRQSAPSRARLPSASQQRAVIAQSWQRADRRAEWEIELVGLVGGDEATARRQDLASQLAGARNTPASDPSGRCRQLRRLGAELAGIYHGLPDQIIRDMAADEYLPRRLAETRLRLVAGRWAAEVDEQLEQAALDGGVDLLASLSIPDLQLDRIAEVELQGPDANSSATGSTSLAVSADEFTRFEWRLRQTASLAREARLLLEYTAKDLEIHDAQGKPWLPGREASIALSPSVDSTIAVLIRARHRSGGQASVRLHAHVGQKKAVGELQLALPAPDRVELAVDGQPGTWRIEGGRLPRITLRPFPSGATPFTLMVRNGSGRAKKLAYTLFSLPKGFSADDAQRLDADDPRRPIAGATMLLKTDLALAAGMTEAPLPLPPLAKPPTDPQPPPADAAAAVEGGPAAADQAPQGIAVENGLLCLLEDTEQGPTTGRQWTWIDVSPLHPGEYLLEPEVWYDRDQQRIVVQLGTKSPDLLPPGGSRVVWELDDPLLLSSKRKRTTAVLKPRASDPQLFAEVEPDRDRHIDVLLTVDDYPRAFIFSVVCDGPAERVPRKLLSLEELAILEPKEDQSYRDTPVVRVTLRADIPPPGLQQRAYRIVVGIPGDSEEWEFTTDRATQVRLLKTDEAGGFALTSTVTDLGVEINTEPYPNQAVAIVARMMRGGAVVKSDQRTVRLDGQAPTVEVVRGARQAIRIRQGEELRLEARAFDDVSGIEHVEFAHGLTSETELKEPKLCTQPEDGDLYYFAFDTKELEIKPHTFYVRAVDRVGLASPIEELVVYIDKSPAGSPAADKSTNKLLVQVLFNGRPLRKKCKVEITAGPKMGSKTTDSDGQCQFTDLPEGDYTLKVEGIAGNKVREGEQTVSVAPPPAKPATAQISLE